jgi:hypothetical protein
MANNGDWIARTWSGKAAQLANIRDKIPGYAADLDLTAGDVTAIQDLCDEGIAIIDHQTQTQSAAQGTTEWRDNSFNAPRGGTLATPPPGVTWAAPTGTKIGILAELRHWRDKWVAADKYSQAIGEDLMIVSTGEPLDPSTAKPTLLGKAAQVGGLGYAVIIGGRGDSDQWKLSGALFGTSDWQDLGMLTGKAYEGTWPGGGSTPIQVQFRAQLYRNNAPYGIPSDIVVVTLIP